MIKLSNVTLQRGVKVLLQDANADVFPGHKVGLIGANGSGKSSLFALLRGELHTEAGSCQIPAGWKIVSVAQETPSSQRSALDYVVDGHTTYRHWQQKLTDAQQQGNGDAIAIAHSELEQLGYDIESRAATILAGLGFANDSLHRPVAAFSGGWRMRMNLARALLLDSDLLLLDEPTNHLDLDAVIWLERWIQRYTGTLLLISHDKAFLDSCVGQILSVEQQRLYQYTGNYSSFEKQRAERLRLQDIEYQKQQEKRAHLQSFIDRFKAKASKAKQAQSRIKQLEKMQELMPAHAQSQFSFSFPEPPKLPNPLISMEEVQVGYDDVAVLQRVKLNLVPGSRIGLLGRNGAGKSTLIKLLAGKLNPLSGAYHTAAGLRIGYFAQHQLDTLRKEDTALAHLQRLDEQATEQQLRDFLGGFGFHGDEALSAVEPMSGGEKARLVLALLVYQQPNLLLLDEPTNHLDLEMRHALNVALQGFSGAMVLVSHDRFLLESVCEDFYLVDSGQVDRFDGDLNDYRDWLVSDARSSASVEIEKPKLDRKDVKRLEAEFRQATKPLRDTIKKQEALMQSVSEKLNDVENQLANPDIYDDANKHTLKSLLAEQVALKQQEQQAEQVWLDAQEALEDAQQELESQLAS
ncbi:ribosomal protection-like ABC-F family protein [Aestuariibacter salexigens]|uniref:ribosomal protection-like ABC-F family protein n=1 Tax=Aestuariibacter salexigens TaxID=226010 RepID=UPI000406836F|nr:ATP-binding cassette domain-containing protein [Aestuariibacter salexigens]